MTPVLAAAPLVAVLLAMGVWRRSAAVAGALGLAAALVLAVAWFDLGPAPVVTVTGAAAEALHSAALILWIILPALALHEFQHQTGAIERIRDALGLLTDDRRQQAILIAWFFGLFVEGAAGFGTPVALAAPLLAGMGYPPVRAVALALLGHAAGVSFGAVGTPTLVQVELTGLDPRALAGTVASLHAALGGILLLAMVRLADDTPLSRADLGWSALALASFFAPSLALAWVVGPELPSLGGALAGATLFAAILARRGGRAGGPSLGGLLPDLAPYLAILALVLASRLLSPLGEALRGVSLGWSFGQDFSGSFEPLYHPGTLLFAGLVFGAAVTGRAAHLPAGLLAALKRLGPVALALLAMLALSRLMVHSGMIEALAAAAAALGPAWPLLAPAIGVLGTFLTGSATASNILFTEFQLSAASALSLPATTLAAAQGYGAAIGNVFAPYNIIAGCATVGLVGREGEILRRTLWAGLVCAGLAGGLVLILAAFA